MIFLFALFFLSSVRSRALSLSLASSCSVVFIFDCSRFVHSFEIVRCSNYVDALMAFYGSRKRKTCSFRSIHFISRIHLHQLTTFLLILNARSLAFSLFLGMSSLNLIVIEFHGCQYLIKCFPISDKLPRFECSKSFLRNFLIEW